MLLLKCILTISFLLTATSMAAQTATSKASTDFVTVCEVLGSRGAYDGKFVALIGRWSPTEEGVWLKSDCANQVKTGDYVWKNIIFLKYDPSSPSVFSNGPDLDVEVANRKIAEIDGSNASRKEERGWAVVYGRIETKENLRTVVGRDGKPRPAGYGHLSGAPAQLVYREKDFVTLPRAGY